ncbi:transforming growth factor beta activator LRRC33 [Ascaphus truei]|uniref:transforming growth factor beta activator LRRC33 n=1 Tax=Ascaphus truei TaxID=8439 RepID=UPI003F5A6C1F
MAIVSFWLLLGCMYLALQWRDNAVEGKNSGHTGCKLFDRAADCSHMQLSSVPQDLPTDIEELCLDSNHLRSLGENSLLHYHNLKILSLRSNCLELVELGAFQGIMRLESLSLQDNTIYTNYGLVSAALRSTPFLKKLDLSMNDLTEDMVTTLLRNLTSLEYLSLDNNVIMRLDDTVFEGLSQLKELSLQRNYIYEIEGGTFEGLLKLRSLNLAYNHLPCIVDFGMTQLQMLNLSFNSIEWFQSQDLDVEFQLERLDISHNRLLFFPLLPRRHHLHSLLLSDNKMRFYANLYDANSSSVNFVIANSNSTNVTPVDLWKDVFVSDLSTLHFLDMSRNQFNYLPDGFIAKMTSLSYLKLNWNCLETFCLPQGEITSTLTELDLSNNMLLELQVDNISQSFLGLSYFNLSSNNLQKLPRHILGIMNSINTLDLSHNQLDLCYHPANASEVGDKACVDITNVPSLRHLHLSGCGLKLDTHHVFYGTTLTHLDLSHNQLKGIHSLLDTAATLQFISLRSTLPFNASVDLSQFQSLIALDLSENFLTTFPTSLTGMALHSLDLRRNNLTSIPVASTYHSLLRSLHTVYLSHNPFDCCELSWLNVLKRLRRIHIPDLQQVTCNFSQSSLSVEQLPESIGHSCQGKTGGTFLYLLLTLPSCLTFLVALLLLFLTVKPKLLKMLKRRCRRSSSC